ncbi:MAG: hydrolase [Boseongicola sp. SB0675_bin_26]|nr:hydrolase [Boseongicola sp. SB0675_bin_26]
MKYQMEGTKSMKTLVTGMLLLVVGAFAAFADEKRILVYGDSNTWGWKPVANGYPTTRHDDATRWGGVLQSELGPEFKVVVDGLVGRTTDLNGGAAGLVEPHDFNGASALGDTLASQGPLDLVVVMLGTNDLQESRNRAPEDVASALVGLANMIQGADGLLFSSYPAPKVLLVAPPPLGDTGNTPLAALFAAGEEPSRTLGTEVVRAATDAGVPVLDAGRAISTDGVDGIHLTAEAHRDLGVFVADKVKDLLSR